MKNTYRFFVPPSSFSGERVRVADPELARQLSRVLRLGPGDTISLLDGLGDLYEVELSELGREQLAGRIVRRESADEPGLDLTLYVAMIRPERFEWVLQKGTELGVQRFVPVQFARSLPADRIDGRKIERWRRIIREAAEQSCRGRLPELGELLSFAEACSTAVSAPLALILWEGAAPPLRRVLRGLRAAPAGVAVLSGPEGGITETELTAADERGIMPVSLGSWILRAETAPIAAAAAFSYEFSQL